MKVIIAPDSFKESLSALEVANAIEKGFRDIFPEAEYVKIPMADGGEGTVQSLVDATGGRIVKTNRENGSDRTAGGSRPGFFRRAWGWKNGSH
jgi:glycerate kinase